MGCINKKCAECSGYFDVGENSLSEPMLMGKDSKTKQTRFQIAEFELTDENISSVDGIVQLKLKFDNRNDQVLVKDAKDDSIIENKSVRYGYNGINKKRTTSKINTNTGDYSLDLVKKINRFKHIVAIDTNSISHTIKDREHKIHLGIAVSLKYLKGEISLCPIEVMFFARENSLKPENENWKNLIQSIVKSRDFQSKGLFGIVIDSDLGNVDSYNNREKPIFEDFFLPENFELIFASDKVSDNLFNKMIKHSHKLSKKMLPIVVEKLRKH